MEQQSSVPNGQPAMPGPPSTSLIARLLNVFAAPGDVFEEVKAARSSVANWLAPALILIFVSWISAALILSQDTIRQQLNDISARAIEKQIEAKKIPPERAEAARQAGEKFGSIGTKISLVAGPVVGAFFSPFLWGLILWIGTKVFKGNSSYMKAVEVAGLANMIGVLDVIVRTLLIVGMGNLFASPGLALLVKDFDPQNTAHSLLALVNVMTFWLLAVRSVGLARLNGASLGKAVVWVFGVWAAWTGLMVGLGAAIRAAFGG
jgi:hypothetical protein